jgi:hypothetical protein
MGVYTHALERAPLCKHCRLVKGYTCYRLMAYKYNQAIKVTWHKATTLEITDGFLKLEEFLPWSQCLLTVLISSFQHHLVLEHHV